MPATKPTTFLLAACVVVLLMFGWYFQEQMQRRTPFPVPDLEWADMASWTTTWRSGGEQHTVTTAQQASQTVAEAYAIHSEAVRLSQQENPPDED